MNERKPDLSNVRIIQPDRNTIQPEVQAELDALFDAERQEAVSSMPAQPNPAFLAQARHDIENIYDNALDWASYSDADPEGKRAGDALRRLGALALLGYNALLERAGGHDA